MTFVRIMARSYLVLALSPAALATPCRLVLAEQSHFDNKLGFVFDLENDSAANAPCKLNTLKLSIGVADGKNWRYTTHTPAWQLDRDYAVKAVIGPTAAELWLDSTRVGQSPGAFTPQSDDLIVDNRPTWAQGAAEYLLALKDVTVIDGRGGNLNFSFLEEASRPVPVMLFGDEPSRHATWIARADASQTIMATFRILAYPNPRVFDPYVDRYGQSRHANWPGKVLNDADLQAATAAENNRLEDWGIPDGYDDYGGLTAAGWKEAATGYFRITQRNGLWWLITPAGNPVFYVGMCTVPEPGGEVTPVTGRTFLFEELPPKSGATAAAWAVDIWGDNRGTEYVGLAVPNLARKYGQNWTAAINELATRRLRTWGFSGSGKWSRPGVTLPVFPVLSRAGVPVVARHPDIFDDNVRAQLRTVLSAQITPRKTDPLVVGWPVGNEYDEIITAQETGDMLKKSASVAAKRALVDQALNAIYGGTISSMAAAWKVSAQTVNDLYAGSPSPPANDIEALRRYFARQYYEFLYHTVKELAPNHLYFGFWIVPGWWENEEDWRLIAANCDVIGYDYYTSTYADALLARLLRDTNKPVLLGEFGFPPNYRMQRGFPASHRATTENDAAAGDLYLQFVRQAAENPYCLGVLWFQYRDEAITGRGPGQGPDLVYGEHNAFGVVDVTDRPKYDLLERMRDINLEATLRRLTQPGASPSCSFSLTPGVQSFSAAAASGAINVTAGAGCAWGAASKSFWITINPAVTGVGSGSVSYSIAANPGSKSRTGTITVVGQNFTVNQTGSSGEQPFISQAGVVNGASFQPGVAAGTWISILGANLAATSRIWRESDFAGARLPTQLDGVSVSINGRPAYVYYISPTQINVLAPGDSTEGAVRVEAITPQGRTTAVIAQKRRFSPAFFLFDPQGRRYLAAVHADGTLAGRNGLFSDTVTTRPARPGETILLFGTGFGPTEPPAPEGAIVTQAGSLTTPVTIRIGNIVANVAFAGLVGAGLYQFNVTVPNVADGDQPVVADIGAFRSQANAFLTVRAQQ